MDLTKINGDEIIAFLNEQSENNDDLIDISVYPSTFVFVDQKIENGIYTLTCTGKYNNWGTLQVIEDNLIQISDNKVECWFSEPFDGDGTCEALEEVLLPWLETHEFKDDKEEQFYIELADVYEGIRDVKFDDKEYLQTLIDDLIRIKTYMK